VRKILIGLMVAVLLTMVWVMPIMAAPGTSQSVTVSATPSFVAVENTPGTWTMNGVKGDGFLSLDTIYYAIGATGTSDITAPVTTVTDADCRFSLTDTSSVNITLKVTMEDFTGGGANMANSEDGSNGAATYGAYSYYSGMTYADKKVVKEVANIGTTTAMYTSTTPGGADIKWAVQVETQTGDWASGTASTATLTVTAAKA
jgi:hypothetical protein